MVSERFLPAEWSDQDAVLMAWPHQRSDWSYMLDQIQSCYIEIIKKITLFQKVILLIPDDNRTEKLIKSQNLSVIICFIEVDDTWIRDYGPITLNSRSGYIVANFKFNGWGLKYKSEQDNLVINRLNELSFFSSATVIEDHLGFTLEGGSIESDGRGTILTTRKCIDSANRNSSLSFDERINYIKDVLGASKVLVLNHGYIEGDDTDSHIDTLARFCDPETIAYVAPTDSDDSHYSELKKMEEELKLFRDNNGRPFKLVPLSMAEPVYNGDKRLPATYANFLILNSALLVPLYGSKTDSLALNQLQKVFKNRRVIGVNCLPLIQENGSLHCATMQIPAGALNSNVF
ncbi:agmatine deiminase family protein [Marinilabiliaceae bacterium ANBcel2]|nr:agmatine deiminase family protein [Marinilabiliaceae bacterium ANBcel2]